MRELGADHPHSGGHLLGYFLPTKAPMTAWGPMPLTAWQKGLSPIGPTEERPSEAMENFRMALNAQPILREERNSSRSYGTLWGLLLDSEAGDDDEQETLTQHTKGRIFRGSQPSASHRLHHSQILGTRERPASRPARLPRHHDAGFAFSDRPTNTAGRPQMMPPLRRWSRPRLFR